MSRIKDIRVVRGMPASQYHAVDAVSSTLIKNILHDETTAGFPVKQSEEMLLGELIHCMVLEPGKVDAEYAAADGRRPKKGEDGLSRDESGRILFTPLNWSRAEASAQAIKTDPECEKILAAGEGEVSMFWTDVPTGLPCKARIDWAGPHCLMDIKTTADPVDADSVQGLVGNWRWWVQDLWYGAAARAALYTNGVTPDFVFSAVNVKADPPVVGTYKIGMDLEKEPGLTWREFYWGRIVEAMGKIRYYRSAGFPTRASIGVQEIEPPRWSK